MTRLPFALIALVVIQAVSACGHGAPGQAAARVPGPASAREAADEATLIRTLALEAHGAMLDADAAYKRLGLNTAAGRKLTPNREAAVRDGLLPVVAKLDATTAAITARLAPGEGSAKLATLREAFAARAPIAGETVAADVAATNLLYRVAQYRLKLGFLVEYALRRGIVAELPMPAPAKPAPGSPTDPGDGGHEERAY